MSEIMSGIRRGAFIVFEGCDKSGKTTQSKRIVSFLENQEIPVKYLNFPARDTPIGNIINAYLTQKQDLPNEGIHLLFSANRWEMQNDMKKLLESGTTLIVDRYSYSGIAYSVAKGLSYSWCQSPEIGLLRPDKVIYLKAQTNELSKRGDFGAERYEVPEFQKKVKSVFEKLREEGKDYWIEMDASRNLNEICADLSIKILKIIEDVQSKSLQTMW